MCASFFKPGLKAERVDTFCSTAASDSVIPFLTGRLNILHRADIVLRTTAVLS